MGCDIHAVVEYENASGFFTAFTNGTAFIRRDNDLFKALAFAEITFGEPMRYPPRGFPASMTWASLEQFIREDAIGLVQNTDVKPLPLNDAESVLRQDLHTPSWLTLRELHEVLDDFQLDRAKQDPTFQAVLAAMEALGQHFGTDKVRLVYCFDG